MPQLTRYEMPYQSHESDPFRKLQEAEENRKIGPKLTEKVEENLDLIANTEQMLHEKRDALVRGIKRLEEKTATVEMWQKKTKLPPTERMTKLKIYKERSIRFNSIIRQNKPENCQNWNFRNPTKERKPALKCSEVAKNGAENL